MSARKGSAVKKRTESGLNRYLTESNQQKKQMPVMFDNDVSSSEVYGMVGNKTYAG